MIVVSRLTQDECRALRLHGGSPDVINPERLPDPLRAVAWDIWDRRPEARSGLVAQPRPRARFRCPVYLAYVRARPCCACGLPGPSDPHHAGPRGVGQTADDCTAVPLCRPCHRHVTDTNALPGLTLEYSRVRLLEAQVQLLSEWVAGQEELVADHVDVPILKRCAS